MELQRWRRWCSPGVMWRPRQPVNSFLEMLPLVSRFGYARHTAIPTALPETHKTDPRYSNTSGEALMVSSSTRRSPGRVRSSHGGSWGRGFRSGLRVSLGRPGADEARCHAAIGRPPRARASLARHVPPPTTDSDRPSSCAGAEVEARSDTVALVRRGTSSELSIAVLQRPAPSAAGSCRHARPGERTHPSATRAPMWSRTRASVAVGGTAHAAAVGQSPVSRELLEFQVTAMTDTGRAREFLCGGKKWNVAPRATPRSGQTGLHFRCDGGTRFLAFTHGALPSARELHSMSDEVLRTLLLRAAAE